MSRRRRRTALRARADLEQKPGDPAALSVVATLNERLDRMA
jgi:hypothetical protein